MLKEILTLDIDEGTLLKILYLASQKTIFLLIAEQNRLLLPVTSSRSEAWKDKLLLIRRGEKYKMPNIIKILIENLYKKGKWDTSYAIAAYFKQIGEPYWESMPDFYRMISFSIGKRIGALIAELKGAGLISPFLKLAPGNKLLYEINPSVKEVP